MTLCRVDRMPVRSGTSEKMVKATIYCADLIANQEQSSEGSKRPRRRLEGT
jgi:hypothetical protein